MREKKEGQRPQKQVEDDPELLELMLQDTESASELYKPTNYWANYEKELLPELRSRGLRDFRRNKRMRILSAFGATDLLPHPEVRNPVWEIFPIPSGRLEFFSKLKAIERLLNGISTSISDVGLKDLRRLSYDLAKQYGDGRGAKSIREFEASTVGNPEDVFFVEGNTYTTSILNYYVQYAYCCKYLDFDSIRSMMELGSGSGKQVEVIKKLHPRICIYIFDIPPQLYVCEQYLSALFPGSVISYRQTRKITNLPKNGEGKVFILGNWKLPEIKDLKYDLFWNSASFQEMEPTVALNYLNYINQQTSHHVFLNEIMEGIVLAPAIGKHGVLEQTKLEHYLKGLKDFQLENLSQSIYFHKSNSPYSFSFWSKRRA